MRIEQFTQQEFPILFGEKETREKCQAFLNNSISQVEFVDYILEKNIRLKDEDERLDEFYRSGGMGRPGIMDGAPQVAQDFRFEIIKILDGEIPRWE